MKRGFIGPIGDDIPSIFPIVAGMLLFISTILYANAQVDARNSELLQREATQKLAYLATQKASFQPGEFQTICANSLRGFAENNGLKFAVVVKKFCERGCTRCSNGIDLLNSNVFNEDEIRNSPTFDPNYVCTSEKQPILDEFNAARLDVSNAPKDAVVLTYPFTVPCPDDASPVKGLATLNVIVWKSK